MIPKLRNISYEIRLIECGLTTPETYVTLVEPPTHLFWPIVQNNDRSHEWRHSKPVVASKFHEEGSIRGIT